MRKILGLAFSCLVACSFFLTVQPAFGASFVYDGAWVNEDGKYSSSITYEVTGDQTPYTFGIYEYGNATNSAVLHEGAGVHFTSLDFEFNDAGYLVITPTSKTGDSEAPLTFTSKGAAQFGFYFNFGSNDVDLYLVVKDDNTSDGFYDLVAPIDGSSYQHIVSISDLTPVNPPNVVPIPTAILLLGSGLVGLAGFKRKMDN